MSDPECPCLTRPIGHATGTVARHSPPSLLNIGRLAGMTEQSDDAARTEAERLDRVAEQRRREAERAQTELEPMTDWELIGERLMPPHITNPMELNRRLKNSVVDLTGELKTLNW